MERLFEFVATKTKMDLVDFKDSFAFREDKKYWWVQKTCFWILKKIGAYNQEQTFSYKKFTIDPQSFMERLFRQKSYITEEFNVKPSKLFIGDEDFSEMMSSKEIRQSLSFNATYNFNIGNETKVMGLKVSIIPWMRGIIVMP